MKSAVHLIISITLVTAVLAACQSPQTRRNIATADSLAEADPAAAINCIDSVSPAADGRRARMMMALLKAKAMNKLMQPIDSAKLKDIVDYFTDHGTANEKMLANYITACSYIDKDNAPMALQYFHEAVEQADTTDNDCDFKTLSRIYAQMSSLFQIQLSSANALEAGKKALKYAILTKDTANAISAYSQLADAYYFTNNFDTVIHICKKAADLYYKYGYKDYAAAKYGIPVFIMIERGEVQKAKPYMALYETNSGLYNQNTKTTLPGHEIYYYTKGMYHLQTDKPDSAEYFFRKEIKANDFNNKQAAAKGLYMLYKKAGIYDSAMKYAEIWNACIDSSYMKLSTTHLQRMQAMYNYSDKELETKQKTIIINRYEYLSVIFIFIIVIVIVLAFLIYLKRKKDFEHIKYLNQANNLNLILLKKKEAELQNLENDISADKKLIAAKTAEIKELQEKLSSMHGLYFNTDNQLFDSPIIERLHTLASHGGNATTAEKLSLIKLINSTLPKFVECLKINDNKLNENEIIICYLVKMQFMPSEIICLLDISSQRLTNIRKRLNNKIFGTEGGAKEFDYRIKHQTPME